MTQNNKKTKCLMLHAINTYACTHTDGGIKGPQGFYTPCIVWWRSTLSPPQSHGHSVTGLARTRRRQGWWCFAGFHAGGTMCSTTVNSPSWAQVPSIPTKHQASGERPYLGPFRACHLPVEYPPVTPSGAKESPNWALPKFLTHQIMRYH